MVSEAPSEEASLSDVFYIYLLILHPRYFTNYVSFHGGGARAPPPPHAGHAVFGSTIFDVHVIILPVAAKSIDINSILIILIIFIMLLNFNGLCWRRPPPSIIFNAAALAYIFQKLNTFLFKFEGNSTPH